MQEFQTIQKQEQNEWRKKGKAKTRKRTKFHVKRNRKILKYQFSLGKQIFFDSRLSIISLPNEKKTKQSNNSIWIALLKI